MKKTFEEYEEERKELLRLNSNLTGIVPGKEELKADGVLSELKKEYLGLGIAFDAAPLFEERIVSSRLYKFCSLLPKGCDLHVHDMALLPAKELIPILKKRREAYINADGKFDLQWVRDGEKVPSGYVAFSDAVGKIFSEEELIKEWTVLGQKESGVGIWDYFEGLFDKHGALSSNPDFAKDYYSYAFRYYCEKKIFHVEIHTMLTDDMDETVGYLNVIRGAYYETKKEYPFFTVRIIGAGAKADNENIELTKRCFLNTAYAMETVKDESDPENVCDFVIGFDLVNEEDSSLPLHAFVPMLLKVKNQYPEMKLYIHGGESLSARNENLVDAYLIGVSRVGHGLNLYRFPDLHSRYIRDEICLEVCPVSNQLLGYTKDIRNHPATEYLKSGAALSLSSDDPAYMENETLTDDFFEAIIGWDLGISEIKQLMFNSVQYSGLSMKEKTLKLRFLGQEWDKFINKIVSEGIN